MKKLLVALLVVSLCLPIAALAAEKKANPLAAWQPKFDPKGAEYTYLLSNLSHPVIEGVASGYRLRDLVWEKSGGRLYIDFRPLGQLGGERDVVNKVKRGMIHGMLASSVIAPNAGDMLGLVTLPYVIDSFDKLDTFRNDPELWGPFTQANPKLVIADITSYGHYGWATKTPVNTIADAKTVNFRIAEAPVNLDTYKAWGLKITSMPWPDVPQALQTDVITGLDHTAIVCNITKKFNTAKYFTELNYAQGLFIHIINKKWLNSLPADLQKILLDAIKEESQNARDLNRVQHDTQVAAAKEAGVQFTSLSKAEVAELKQLAEPVLEKWGKKMGPEYLAKVREKLAK